jgi:ADP-ribose pyrophosphatase YjhB (NUDIX family)
MTAPGNDRVLDFSDSFVLSSGTVSIDYSKGLVLLLYYPPKREYLLPKGRKNIGESLQDAAVRETKEESGYKCHLLQHDIPTKAPSFATSLHTEPFAVQQRMSQGIRKIIFWYLAHADSSESPIGQSLEEGEDFEVRWVRKEVAPSTMSFVEDQKIVERALTALSCSFSDSALSIP